MPSGDVVAERGLLVSLGAQPELVQVKLLLGLVHHLSITFCTLERGTASYTCVSGIHLLGQKPEDGTTLREA